MISPGWAAVWTLIASVVAAVAGTTSALVVKRRTDRMTAKLDYVNAQLRYFYGPLLGIFEASERSWKVFKSKYRPEDTQYFWDLNDLPTLEMRAAWLHWITTVLIPTNSRMVEIISERADLLIEEGMPECLTQLSAHILTLKSVLASWRVESDDVPKVPDYPSRDLQGYLRDSFLVLKQEQVRLLKAVGTSRAYPLTQNTSHVPLITDRTASSASDGTPSTSTEGRMIDSPSPS